jgi:hypothetical protein
VQGAGRISKNDWVAAELAEEAYACDHFGGLTAFVQMHAARQAHHVGPADLAEHQFAGVPCGPRDRKSWDLRVGHPQSWFDAVPKAAEPGAEHEPDASFPEA